MYFSEPTCHFLLICFQVHMSKISAKSDKFFLNYSNLFGGGSISYPDTAYMPRTHTATAASVKHNDAKKFRVCHETPAGVDGWSSKNSTSCINARTWLKRAEKTETRGTMPASSSVDICRPRVSSDNSDVHMLQR